MMVSIISGVKKRLQMLEGSGGRIIVGLNSGQKMAQSDLGWWVIASIP
jgi:hypothetical protein